MYRMQSDGWPYSKVSRDSLKPAVLCSLYAQLFSAAIARTTFPGQQAHSQASMGMRLSETLGYGCNTHSQHNLSNIPIAGHAYCFKHGGNQSIVHAIIHSDLAG